MASTVTLIPAGDAPRSAAACFAHYATHDGEEITAPCGTPFELRTGYDAGWIELGERITSCAVDVSEGGVQRIPVDAISGNVLLPARALLRPGKLVLYSLLPAPQGRKSFERTVPIGEAMPRSIAMPSGSIIAVEFDDRDRPVAISKPEVVPARGEQRLSFDNATGIRLLALLQHGRTDDAESPGAFTVSDPRGKHNPETVVEGADRVLVAWFGLAPGDLKLDLQSNNYFVTPVSLHAAKGEPLFVRAPLKRLPTLTVAVGETPEGDRTTKPAAMTLSLFRAGEKNAIRVLPVKLGGIYPIERLPTAPIDVAVNIGGFITGTRADLSSGDDLRVTVPLHPIAVTGVVHYGQDPARAEIRVLQRGDPLIVHSDDRGEYSMTLWAPGRFFVDTLVTDQPSLPPFRTLAAFDSSRTYDIDVPKARLSARVFNRDDGTPIPGASIAVRSTALDPETNRESTTVVTLTTASAALTPLPPIREGSADIVVRAAGYDDSPPIALPPGSVEGQQVVDVPMKRIADAVALHVVLPSGVPAAGAEVATTSPAMTLTWRGLTGADGIAQLPKTLGGSYLLIRHPDAASSWTLLPPQFDSLPTMGLMAAAPPLTIRVESDDGKAIGPAPAAIALWMNGRVTDAALAFLTWSSAATAIDGTWVARNLPAGYPIGVVITRRGGFESLKHGTYDSFVATVNYPWPATVVMRPAD